MLRVAEEKSIALMAAQKNVTSAHEAAEETTARFLTKVKALFPNIKSLADVSRALTDFDELCERLTKAEYTLLSEQSICDALSQNFSGDPTAEDESVLSPPLRSREDNAEYLKRIAKQIEDESAKFNIASGEARALGDPAAISAAVNYCRDEIAAQEKKYAALQLASGTLNDAYTEMQNKFSPLLGAEAGKFMRELTGGKYEKLTFNRTFWAEARETGASVATHRPVSFRRDRRPALFLSAPCHVPAPHGRRRAVPRNI